MVADPLTESRMDTQPQQSPLLPLIREQVKRKLTASQAFLALPREKQVEVAHDTVNALHYILGGQDGTLLPRSMTLGGNSAAFTPAQALATPATPVTPAGRPASAGGAPGAGAPGNRREPRKGFGEAADAGSQSFTDTIANVNFPAFVGGLIDGVFNSIVTTSIKQMEAYATMVKNVSKSVDQYMKDNVTENHARDYLADRYPDHLQVDISGEKPVLKPKEGYDESSLPDFFSDLGLKSPVTSLDEDNVEQQLVPAARRRIAMDRQQLLATMVMMGVNRLVVTNGTIEASCLFELDTTDTRKRDAVRTTDAEQYQEKYAETGQDGSYGEHGDAKIKGNVNYNWSHSSGQGDGEFGASYDAQNSWYSHSNQKNTANFKMHTVNSASSEASINLHAQLGGKVKVNFKSDYFPMEKMIDALQVQQIQEKTAAGIAPKPQAAPLPPPAMPPMPALPGVGAPAAAPAASPAAAPATPAR
ncbi:hypothetical protein WK60_00170 [Burkholderia ubonensis]|nr:hypothetical protein WK60_00170 [Burkholderia ubonensis]